MGGKRRLTSRGSSKQQSANYDRSGTLSCSSPRLRPILWAEVGLWSGATLDFEFLRDEVVRSNALAFPGFCRGGHRFRDRPQMLDEKLNHRAERPVFPGHDPDRRTSSRRRVGARLACSTHAVGWRNSSRSRDRWSSNVWNARLPDHRWH